MGGTAREEGARLLAGLLRMEGLQVGLELIEGGGEALVEGIQHGFEEFEFFSGWVKGLSDEGQGGEVELLAEGEGHKDLEGPFGVEGGACDVALGIGEGIDENEPVGWKNFAVDEFSPHFLAVWHAQAVEKLAAGPEVHVTEADGATFGAPPAAEAVGVGPRAEDKFARGVESAGNHEVAVVGTEMGRMEVLVGSGHEGSFRRMRVRVQGV